MNKSLPHLRDPQHHQLAAAYAAQLQRERYSRQTVRNYTNHFIKFLQYCDNRPPGELRYEEVFEFIEAESKRGLSVSTINVLSYSIRYYYERVHRKPHPASALVYRK